eukprot:2556253-Pleurochrysis_carterae.AAC.1
MVVPPALLRGGNCGNSCGSTCGSNCGGLVPALPPEVPLLSKEEFLRLQQQQQQQRRARAGAPPPPPLPGAPCGQCAAGGVGVPGPMGPVVAAVPPVLSREEFERLRREKARRSSVAAPPALRSAQCEDEGAEGGGARVAPARRWERRSEERPAAESSSQRGHLRSRERS